MFETTLLWYTSVGFSFWLIKAVREFKVLKRHLDLPGLTGIILAFWFALLLWPVLFWHAKFPETE